VAGTLSLLKAFATRQGGGSPYTAFATDHDLNYLAIETWAAGVTSELALLGGNDAPLGSLAIINETAATGRIGEHSAAVTGSSASGTTLSAGSIYTGGTTGVVAIISATVTATTQPSGTLTLAMNANGILSWEVSGGLQAIDLYSRASWNGTIFTVVSDEVAVAAILPDADEIVNARQHAGGLAGDFPVTGNPQLEDRLLRLENFLERNRSRTSQVAGFDVATGALTPVDMDTEVFKDGVTFTATSDNHTIVLAGLYLIVGTIDYDETTITTAGSGQLRDAAIYDDAVELARQSVRPSTTNNTRVEVTALAEIAAASIVELRAFQDASGADSTINVSASLAIVRLGPIV